MEIICWVIIGAYLIWIGNIIRPKDRQVDSKDSESNASEFKHSTGINKTKSPIKNKITIVLNGTTTIVVILLCTVITGYTFKLWLTYEIVQPEDTMIISGEIESVKKIKRQRDTDAIAIFLKNKHIRFRSSIGFPEYFKRDDFLKEAQFGNSVEIVVHRKDSNRLTASRNDNIETINVIGLKMSGKNYLTVDEYIKWDKNNMKFAGYAFIILLLSTIVVANYFSRTFFQLYKKLS